MVGVCDDKLTGPSLVTNYGKACVCFDELVHMVRVRAGWGSVRVVFVCAC